MSLTNNPKLYVMRKENLMSVNSYPSNNNTSLITNFDSEGHDMEIKLEGGQDNLYLCTDTKFVKYNVATDTKTTLITFDNTDSSWFDDTKACLYLRSSNRMIHII